MLNLQNVSLALVLSAPFGLAIHDELTKETPEINEHLSGLFGSDYLGYDDPEYVYDDDDVELSDEEVARILREAGSSGELADVEPEEAAPELTPAALQELFGAERATLGPSLSGARFGMAHDQVVAAVPNIGMFSLGDPDMFPGVAVYPEYAESADARLTRLTRLTVGLRDPSDRVEDHLVRAWGEPQITNEGEGFVAWIGADGHSRAVLAREGRDLREISFDHAITVQELFARPRQGKGVFSFENQRPILGATIEQLQAGYDNVAINPYDQQSGELVLSGIATDHEARASLVVELLLSEGKVTHMILMVPCQDDACTDVVAAATRRFGTPAPIGDEAEGRLRFGKAPAVTVNVLESERLAEVTATFATE